MTIEQVAAQVAGVLSRAESLFAVPQEASAASDELGLAADASDAIAARVAEQSGALAAAHSELLAASRQRLHAAAGTDATLAGHLSDAGAGHGSAAGQAAGLRSAAQAVGERAAHLPELASNDVAALKALRAQVGAMQKLIAAHTAAAADAAKQVRQLRY